jgi:hypothetical protein
MSKNKEFFSVPANRDWLVANFAQASVQQLARYLGISPYGVSNFIAAIGSENIPSVVHNRRLKPDPVFLEWLRNQDNDVGIMEMWKTHTIAEIARIKGWAFPEAAYFGRKKKLPFDDIKLAEIEEREAEARKNKYRHYVKPENGIMNQSKKERKDGYDTFGNGAKCNGCFII